MARGTWQGSGTWQTSGPDFGLIVPVGIAVVVVAVVEFILSIIVWLAIAAGVVLVLAAAGLVWWLHGAPKRRAEYAALYAAAFEARRTVTATATPQVTQGTAPPAIEQHVHYHYHAPVGQEPARVIPGKVLP